MGNSPPDNVQRRAIILGAIAITIMALTAYAPALHNGFIWDDDDYVTENTTLRSAGGLADIWLKPSATPQYYPLVHSSFWLEYHLWGLSPSGYHLDNVILHILGALLLWTLLRRISAPGAWLAAAIFALHPVHVESVAWVTERKNVLSGVFYLSSALAFLSFAGVGREDGEEGPSWQYWASCVLFVCALLSKSVTASLPVILALVIWWKKGRLPSRYALRLVPYLVVGGISGYITSWLEKHQVGALGSEWSLSLLDRVLLAGRALWFYAGKLAWPADLSFFYPRWKIDPGAAVHYLYPLLALAVIAALWLLRGRLGKSAFVGVASFAVTLFPALGFLNVYPMRYSWVADHFQYLASIGVIALAAGALAAALDKLPSRARSVLTVIISGVILASLGALTWRQTHVYRDLRTLWTDTLAKNPDSWAAMDGMGMVLADDGEPTKAALYFRRALALKPDHWQGWLNLGTMLLKLDDKREAEKCFRRGLEYEPTSVDLLASLGTILAGDGRWREAAQVYETMASAHPGFLDPHMVLADMYEKHGMRRDAIRHLEAAVDIMPDLQFASDRLAILRAEERSRAAHN